MKKKLLAAGIAAILVQPAIADVTHTDADSLLLAGANVINVDQNTSTGVTNNGPDTFWAPTTTDNNVVHVTLTPKSVVDLYGGYCTTDGCNAKK